MYYVTSPQCVPILRLNVTELVLGDRNYYNSYNWYRNITKILYIFIRKMAIHV